MRFDTVRSRSAGWVVVKHEVNTIPFNQGGVEYIEYLEGTESFRWWCLTVVTWIGEIQIWC